MAVVFTFHIVGFRHHTAHDPPCSSSPILELAGARQASMTREPDALAAGTKPERPEPEPNGRDIAHEAIGPPMETAVCVVTRFRLRSPLDLIATYLDFLRIKREVGRFPGLLRVSFLFGGMRT
jgi:hypothetical protein